MPGQKGLCLSSHVQNKTLQATTGKSNMADTQVLIIRKERMKRSLLEQQWKYVPENQKPQNSMSMASQSPLLKAIILYLPLFPRCSQTVKTSTLTLRFCQKTDFPTKVGWGKEDKGEQVGELSGKKGKEGVSYNAASIQGADHGNSDICQLVE